MFDVILYDKGRNSVEQNAIVHDNSDRSLLRPQAPLLQSPNVVNQWISKDLSCDALIQFSPPWVSVILSSLTLNLSTALFMASSCVRPITQNFSSVSCRNFKFYISITPSCKFKICLLHLYDTILQYIILNVICLFGKITFCPLGFQNFVF